MIIGKNMTGTTQSDISIEDVARSLITREVGAVVTFMGVVRDDDIEMMELEAFREVADTELAAIRREALEKFDLVRAEVVHRLGRLMVGEKIVVIACSAAHRENAFAGCRYIIEELKKRAPIWKKEFRPSGESWVNER
jgi:molybdopterin synthase catalytic subunit